MVEEHPPSSLPRGSGRHARGVRLGDVPPVVPGGGPPASRTSAGISARWSARLRAAAPGGSFVSLSRAATTQPAAPPDHDDVKPGLQAHDGPLIFGGDAELSAASLRLLVSGSSTQSTARHASSLCFLCGLCIPSADDDERDRDQCRGQQNVDPCLDPGTASSGWQADDGEPAPAVSLHAENTAFSEAPPPGVLGSSCQGGRKSAGCGRPIPSAPPARSC